MKFLEALLGVVSGAVAGILIAIIVGWMFSVAANTVVYEVTRDRANSSARVSEAQQRAYKNCLKRGMKHEDAVIEAMYGDVSGGAK